MSNCGTLAEGIDVDCDNLPFGGTDPNVLFIKKAEWDLAVANATITFDGSTTNLITAIVLTSGDQGYLFECFNDMVKPVITGVKKPSGYRYKQTVEFGAIGSKAAIEKKIKDMGNERYVAVYINQFKDEDGEGKYKVIGVEAGLKRPDGGAELDKYNDIDGVWLLKMESEDHALEATPEYSFYNTDEATTDAQFVVLQSVAA